MAIRTMGFLKLFDETSFFTQKSKKIDSKGWNEYWIRIKIKASVTSKGANFENSMVLNLLNTRTWLRIKNQVPLMGKELKGYDVLKMPALVHGTELDHFSAGKGVDLLRSSELRADF